MAPFKIFSNFRPNTHPTYDGIKAICKDKPITFFYDYIPQNIEQLIDLMIKFQNDKI